MHEQLVLEGMLSPHANQFYLSTDATHRRTENEIEQNNSINKSTIASKIQRNAEDITLQEEIQLTKENED